MVSPRGARLLLDNLCGMTMQKIADREGLHLSRVGQIITKAKSAIDWHPGMTKQQVGAKCCRHLCFRDDTPEGFHREGFHRELEREDREKAWPRRFGGSADDE